MNFYHIIIQLWYRAYTQSIRNCLLGAVHKVGLRRVTLFWIILTSLLCHSLSHISGTPQKYVTHLGPPPVLVGLGLVTPSQYKKIRTKTLCTNSLSIVRGGFCPGLLSRGFCGGACGGARGGARGDGGDDDDDDDDDDDYL